ncbi:SH3 domain-containing protein [Chryseobacterium polytrichastri]|uniref:SH3 domain-containing protein n=1 Tax=Chryseobacterium polytrichastri TaxID=1302687 RepID=A0A1M6XW42_9FLAO|nr:SH3 domain-containing protein [Chryseobacterium polytrichastri]SHL10099.1 SH3 domain-containing protein [Chryseobacterium polytrichastri]
MKKHLLIFFWILFSCQEGKKDLDNTLDNKSIMNNEERLIDRITIDNTIFKKDDIDLKKYQYEGHYIEDLKIKDLLDKNYRNNFIKYLKDIKTEDDEFKSSLLSQLLLIRIVQLSDSNAFYILSEVSKNELISYNGIELYESTLIEVFLENPFFFIQQSVKYNDSSLVDYAIKMFEQYLIDQDFLDMNLGYIKNSADKKLLLLDPKNQSTLGYIPLVKKLETMPKIQIQLGPSFYTNFKTQEKKFTDISPILGENLLNKLNSSEKNFYAKNIYSIISKYIIENNSTPNYSIQDPDGYTNLRKDKNASSEILQQIKSGELIDVLENQGDWWLVKTNEGKQGYVHKNRVKAN